MASNKLTLDIDIESVKGWLEKADMVAVVRCKDCKYSYVDEKTAVCGFRGFFVREDFFCADGERRIDEVD